MKTINLNSALSVVTGVLFCLAGSTTANASSSFVTFSVDMAKMIESQSFTPGADAIEVHGSFNGWGAVTLVQSGSSTVYTNTIEDTSDANGGIILYKFVINGSTWESLPTGGNRAARLPSTSGGKLLLPTCFFNDAGDAVTSTVKFQVDLSQQINVGAFHPDTDFVVVRGTFNSWSGSDFTLANDTSITVTNQYGLVSTNVYVGSFEIMTSPGAMQEFKYVINGSAWESPSAANSISGSQGGNRFLANTDQTLPIVFFSDAPYAPVAGMMFSVDMSVILLQDPSYDPGSVTMYGSFNGWSGGIAMTNNASSSTPNVYTTSSAVSNGIGSTIEYQFRYINGNASTVYDHLNGVNGGSGNRVYTVPNVTFTNVPAVYFNDAQLADYLSKDMQVTFQVDMTGAVGTDSHTFTPDSDDVYINGAFINWYKWSTATEVYPAEETYKLFPAGNNIYTNTITIPAGLALALDYKYGIDEGRVGGPFDVESGSKTNHFRVIRSLVSDTYIMPLDKFGTMYKEPYFSSVNSSGGNLSITPAANGNVSLTWLGCPGALLQYCTNLTSPKWITLSATDGTYWPTGFTSTNGFTSQTNWPASGQTQFFRLIKK